MYIILIIVGVLAIAAAYWAGYQRGLRQASARYAEDLVRIEPPSRTPGQPTNLAGDPARVTEPKRRPGHFMS